MTIWAESLVYPLESAWSVLNKGAWLNSGTIGGFLAPHYPVRFGSRSAGTAARRGADELPTWLRKLAPRPGAIELRVDGRTLAADLRERWCQRPGGMAHEEELRTCPTCLEVGYHGALHQIVGYERCAIHAVPLRSGCPACERPLSMVSAIDDHGAPPYACSACGIDRPERWMPLWSKRREATMRTAIGLALEWLRRAEGVFLPEGRVPTAGAPDAPYADLQQAKAYACLFAEPYPDALARPLNPLRSVSFDIVPGERRILTRYWRAAPLRQCREAGILMQEILDGVEADILRLLSGRHRCVGLRTPVSWQPRGGARWEVIADACPLGAALAIWREWGGEFLELLHREGWAVEGIGDRETQAHVKARLLWEWCDLAARLAEAYGAKGRRLKGHRFEAMPWWEQQVWCAPHPSAEPVTCQAAAFPVADYTLWAGTFACPYGQANEYGRA